MPPAGLAAQQSNDTDLLFQFTHGLHGVDQELNYLFVHVLVFSFVALCVLTFLLRFMRMANAHLRHLSTMGSTRQAFWAENQTSWWPAIKKHLLWAPLWRNRHNREIQLSQAVSIGTLPSRFHMLLLVVYVMSNVAYCLILPWDNPESGSVIAALRGRTGTLAALNLIPTILFAMRNNPLIPLLRVSYDTFNLLHRWAARLVILESVLHTVAWAVNAYTAGKWSGINTSLAKELSYQWGMVGTCAMLFMAIQAWSPIRHAFYETFLNMHRLFALFALVGVYVHIDAHSLPQVPWMQVIFLFWGLEYLFRVSRIVYYNVSPRAVTRITVEALPAEACRVTFDLVRPWTIRPGCHVHVYMPTLSLWSSHPFSIAWAETRPTNPIGSDSEKLPTSTPDLDLDLDRASGPRKTTITLLIRARTGFTRHLFNKASSAPGGRFTTFGAIEGPYGGHERLNSFGTVLLFAGGVGITHQLLQLRALLASAANGSSAVRKVVLVWSIPNHDALEWVKPYMDSILRMQGRREVLEVKLFVTKPRHAREVVSGTGTVRMFPGRCNVQALVDGVVRERVGAVGVVVCGPGAMGDGVRAACRRRVGVGALEFVEEAFTY
ncbi:hypothetical protein W97_01551 [Coniosporium apollinis CBS 100218]|uniref:FAD-binding FR-type domain-containing protein n=1 Tax=Coniosporium apollinis (strain CBS 100218) TaxID=1168221 RepID=R7YKA1_CONA1|nr:uncharacterized protein W97_01551 [Coniosporium apollinis CBS 100218]EON62330.1 hypothetical protein W97_01551 [Coniosporium apollinis CBS 100218]